MPNVVLQRFLHNNHFIKIMYFSLFLLGKTSIAEFLMHSDE